MSKGFIIDVPKALIKTATGNKAFLHASSGEVTFGGDSIEINGGWSAFAIQEIDTKKTIEIKLTDTEWSLDSMAMTSGGTVSTGATEFEFFGANKTISEAGKITIAKAVVVGSISISGYTETTSATPAAKQFKVTISGNSTEVLFPVADAGKVVSPSYRVSIASAESLVAKTTDYPKSGEVTLTFPVYADPESETSDIVGYCQIIVYKGKIKQESKVGGSFKSASTFDTTVKGLDPRREDEAMWKATYISREDYVA